MWKGVTGMGTKLIKMPCEPIRLMNTYTQWIMHWQGVIGREVSGSVCGSWSHQKKDPGMVLYASIPEFLWVQEQPRIHCTDIYIYGMLLMH